jgi:hypothetical protein
MEEKKFDLNSIIGFALIFGILMWIMYQNQPTEQEVAAEKAKKEQVEKAAKTPNRFTSTGKAERRFRKFCILCDIAFCKKQFYYHRKQFAFAKNS